MKIGIIIEVYLYEINSDMLNKKKIVHIVSDPKFVSQIDKFQSAEMENKLIFWGEKGELPAQYDRMAMHVEPKKKNVAKVGAECTGADLVVVHSLMTEIIPSLPKDVKIAWRFFGYEIYERILPKVLSQETLAIYTKQKPRKAALANFKSITLQFLPMLSSFNRSLNRINYFLGNFQEEYQLLKSLGYKLPSFLQNPINLPAGSYVNYEKKPILLLGNSRIFFNNHIDIIRTLQKADSAHNIMTKLPFSYGEGIVYENIIKEEALKIPNVEFIEQFVPRHEYEKLFQHSAALLINSYRQMGLGNIFIALRTGTKVYLSEKNITLNWLRDNQFKIFSIENDFYNDLKGSDFFLAEADARQNFEKMIELANSYTVKDFQRDIIGIINK